MSRNNFTVSITRNELARKIDHTALDPRADRRRIESLCKEAVTNGFFSVCVNPAYVTFAAQQLAGTGVAVCTVVGFPLGASTASVKAYEAAEAVEHGASEIDMVINIGAVKSGDLKTVEQEVAQVVKAVAPRVVKVILETCYLTDAEKTEVARLVASAGAAFVKTSTGFADWGATLRDVRLLRQAVGDRVGVKASGGIRDVWTALAMLDAGATRLGTSHSMAILAQFDELRQ